MNNNQILIEKDGSCKVMALPVGQKETVASLQHEVSQLRSMVDFLLREHYKLKAQVEGE